MANSNSYRQEQELIFQQIEEMELGERQAQQAVQDALQERYTEERCAFIERLCRSKAFQNLVSFSAADEKVAIVQACIGAWEKAQANS
ncbi:MAG: hypothetical protein ABI824_16735 [Acidobacteriota bacterium]